MIVPRVRRQLPRRRQRQWRSSISRVISALQRPVAGPSVSCHCAAARRIAKPARSIYKRRVVARTEEDLHDNAFFADRLGASEVGCLRALVRALSDNIDRADIPIPETQ
jgi:hypothetical protein